MRQHFVCFSNLSGLLVTQKVYFVKNASFPYNFVNFVCQNSFFYEPVLNPHVSTTYVASTQKGIPTGRFEDFQLK